MQDLTCLISTPIDYLGGKYDDIFPMDSAREAFETVKNISLGGAPENAVLLRVNVVTNL